MLAKKQVMSKAVGSSVQEESRSDWKEPEEVESVEDVVFKPVLPVNEAVFRVAFHKSFLEALCFTLTNDGQVMLLLLL